MSENIFKDLGISNTHEFPFDIKITRRRRKLNIRKLARKLLQAKTIKSTIRKYLRNKLFKDDPDLGDLFDELNGKWK